MNRKAVSIHLSDEHSQRVFETLKRERMTIAQRFLSGNLAIFRTPKNAKDKGFCVVPGRIFAGFSPAEGLLVGFHMVIAAYTSGNKEAQNLLNSIVSVVDGGPASV